MEGPFCLANPNHKLTWFSGLGAETIGGEGLEMLNFCLDGEIPLRAGQGRRSSLLLLIPPLIFENEKRAWIGITDLHLMEANE